MVPEIRALFKLKLVQTPDNDCSHPLPTILSPFFFVLRNLNFVFFSFQFFLRRQVTPIQFLGAFFIVVSIAVAKTPDIVQVMASFIDVRTGEVIHLKTHIRYSFISDSLPWLPRQK
jgi:hypothetical protein